MTRAAPGLGIGTRAAPDLGIGTRAAPGVVFLALNSSFTSHSPSVRIGNHGVKVKGHGQGQG